MKSRIVRISSNLGSEIERIAKKNRIKFIDASNEIAKMLNQKKNKTIIREIEF